MEERVFENANHLAEELGLSGDVCRMWVDWPTGKIHVSARPTKAQLASCDHHYHHNRLVNHVLKGFCLCEQTEFVEKSGGIIRLADTQE